MGGEHKVLPRVGTVECAYARLCEPYAAATTTASLRIDLLTKRLQPQITHHGARRGGERMVNAIRHATERILLRCAKARVPRGGSKVTMLTKAACRNEA